MIRYLILVFAMILIVEATIKRDSSNPLMRHRYSMAIRRAATVFPYGLLKMATPPDFGSAWDDQTKVQLERGEHMATERHGSLPASAA